MDEHIARSHVALALDVPTLDDAKRLIERTRESVGVFKVGLELYTAVGPSVVEVVADAGAKCFLDLKLHDIPATMARAVARARALGVDYLTVHGSAGRQALAQANDAAGDMILLAVTILTSFDEGSLAEIGFGESPDKAAQRLAELAWDSGIRGFVSSAHECRALRDTLGKDAFLVTPGIRPARTEAGDQKRVMTPAAAIEAGSNLLVVGRPIRDAEDPTAAAASLVDEVRAALPT